MKSNTTSKKPPANAKAWNALLDATPGKARRATKEEKAKWAGAVVVKSGGYAAVREAVAAKRKQGARGAQVAPTKQLVSVRYSPEVLEFFRASGAGWQTQMDEVLKQWVASHATNLKGSR